MEVNKIYQEPCLETVSRFETWQEFTENYYKNN